ncbi:expressed unknown protein [Seminavis robusta]|uniref:Uncharacterized protein n=1 Tax=Seminavis robusta TaxID=568900 RepID=A0A9N8EX02_9STRA|nr:expressed unknown protein [Seminavis robusta]|eukprot:Sro2599_g332260.1 n/a (282) ;mRNA; r:7122-7967
MISSNKAAIFSLLAFLLGGVTAQNHFQAQQQDLNRNQALWKSKQMTSYHYDYEKMGPDPLNTVYPWTITVQPPNPPTAKDGNHNQILWTTHSPIGKFFEVIQGHINANTAKQIDVQYNPQLGYPQTIYVVLANGVVYDVDLTNVVPIHQVSPLTNRNPTPVQQIAQAEAQWKSKHIYNYAYVYNNHGSNPHNIVFPWDVTVRNGNQASGKDGNHNQIFYEPHPQTVEELFQRIRNAYSQQAKFIEVRYNKVYGFPEDIFIVYNDQTPDATHDAEITNFMIQ